MALLANSPPIVPASYMDMVLVLATSSLPVWVREYLKLRVNLDWGFKMGLGIPGKC